MNDSWIEQLLQSEDRIVAGCLERVRQRNLPGYAGLPEPQLEQLARTAINTGLSALASGEIKPLDQYAAEIGSSRATQGGIQLWEIIGFTLCVKDSAKAVATTLVANPAELIPVLQRLDGIIDRVIVRIADAYSRGKEQAIRAEEGGYMSMAEILREEIQTTDLRLQHLEAQIAAAREDLKEMQTFREALLTKLVRAGITEQLMSS